MMHSSMPQYGHEFTWSHHCHLSPPSHHSPPHPTIPVFPAPIDHASRSSERTNAPHAADRQVAISAEEQHFSDNQALTQGQYPISTPNAHQWMAGDAGRPENTLFHPLTGVTHPNPSYTEDYEYNHNSLQGSQSCNPTQANADSELFAMLEMLGSGSSSYSQPSYTPRHGTHDSCQSLQNTTTYSPPVDTGLCTEPDQYMLPPTSAFGSRHHMLQQPNPTNYTLTGSRTESDPPIPLPPSASQSHVQQQRSPTDHSLPADPYSRTGSSISMSHSPSAFGSHSHRSHSDINRHLLTQTRHVRPGSSLSRQTSHNHPDEACRWLYEDNQLCDFEGSLEALKVHIRSTHLSGPQNAQVECRWERCRHRRRGYLTDRTMRRDSVWRHVQEKHLNIKYRKKPPLDHH